MPQQEDAARRALAAAEGRGQIFHPLPASPTQLCRAVSVRRVIQINANIFGRSVAVSHRAAVVRLQKAAPLRSDAVPRRSAEVRLAPYNSIQTYCSGTRRAAPLRCSVASVR